MTEFSRRKFLGVTAFALTSSALTNHAVAKERVYSSWRGAIRGHDPVAYFKVGKPVKGKFEHSLEHAGATWYFSSAENYEAFKASPEKYMPAYGGYCAWAMAKGYFASTVPEAWDIVDGRLFLNYSLGVRTQWREDIPGNIEMGDVNWRNLFLN